MRGIVLDLLGFVCGDGVMSDETRVYNCGGFPVELTLPEGEHDFYPFLHKEAFTFEDTIKRVVEFGRVPVKWDEMTFTQLEDKLRYGKKQIRS